MQQPGLHGGRIDLRLAHPALGASAPGQARAGMFLEKALHPCCKILARLLQLPDFREIAATDHLLGGFRIDFTHRSLGGLRCVSVRCPRPAEQRFEGDPPLFVQAADHLHGQAAPAFHDLAGAAGSAYQQGQVFLLVAHLVHPELDGRDGIGVDLALRGFFILLDKQGESFQFVLLRSGQ